MKLSAPGHFQNILPTSLLEVYCGMTLVNLVLESVTLVTLADKFRIHCHNCRRTKLPLLKHNELYIELVNVPILLRNPA